LAGTVVQLECFSLQAADWVVMGEGKTEAQGQLRIRVEMPLSDEATAPQVRLTLAAAPAQRVLAEGGRISYAPRTGLLSIDFGTLSTLAQPVPLQPATADRRFRAVVSPQMMGVSAAARPLFHTTGATTTPLRDTVAITRPGVTLADTVTVPIRGVDLDNNPTVIDLRKQIATKDLDLTGITQDRDGVLSISSRSWRPTRSAQCWATPCNCIA
jgi:hypothetical protein